MSTKSITITVEAYERLAAKKEPRESFSDVILKVTGKGKLSDFAGILSGREAALLGARVKEGRERSRKRAEIIRRGLKA